MSRFVELKRRTYYRGGYISDNMYVAIDDISRVVECADDSTCTNIVTKDGKIHTLNERYDTVVKKIRHAEEDNDHRKPVN